MYESDKRWRHALFGFLVAGVMAFTGCASTGPKKIDDAGAKTAQLAESQPAKPKVSVEYVNVVGDGDRVLIGTTGTVKYTVFKLTDPSRIIVDMPGVDLSKVNSPISVDNGYIKDITSVSYGEDKEIGRLIIGLREGIDHEVKSGENSILISLAKAGAASGGLAEDTAGAVTKAASVVESDLPAAADTAAAAAKPVAEAAPVAEASAEPAAEAASVESAAPAQAEPVQAAQAEPAQAAPAQAAPAKEAAEPLSQATKIVSIEREKAGENTIIRVKADGLIGNYNAFTLDDPSRIVVDMWTIENGTGKKIVKMSDDIIKDVRIGEHPDKTRLVFDAVKGLPPHTVMRSIDTIVITIGKGAAPEKAVAEAPQTNTAYGPKAAELGVAHMPAEAATAQAAEPQVSAPEAAPAVTETPVAEEAAPAPEPENAIDVTDVGFKKVGDVGRLTILTSEKVNYTVNKSADGKTVLIDIKGAVIPEQLHRTLDASKLETSVATISSYQERVLPVKDVRVLVKLKDKTAYQVNQVGGVIQVEFPVPVAKAAAESPEAALAKAAEANAEAYKGKKIDIDMMDANVRDVLRLLAEISNLNIIASDDVTGTVSLRLKGVPWDQAFDIILKAKGLDSIKEGNVIRVAPAAKIAQEKVSLIASKKANQKLEDLEIEFIPINYAKAGGLVKQVQSVLTERGTVNSDDRTNTLIVKDVKDGLASALSLVKKLDTPMPQVLIEARIVEATTSFARDLGIQWGLQYQSSGNVSTNTFGSTEDTTFPGVATNNSNATAPATFPSTSASTSTENYAVNLPVTGGQAGTLGALGFVFGKAGVNPLVLDLRLSAGESEGNLKTISRPRVTTMDNKEAKIEQGESVPFETTSASGTSTTFIDANLSLTVTPHITPDGSVLMKVKASRNSIGTFKTSSGEPSISKKEASTELLVRDGETTVIGGIVITDKNDTEQGIPWLKDIPVIGWFFKNSSKSDSQKELLIFITPTILKEKITG